jgi:hypothetical protein
MDKINHFVGANASLVYKLVMILCLSLGDNY